jgi:hypothetical protein
VSRRARRVVAAAVGGLVAALLALFLFVRSMGTPPVDPAIIARAVHQEPALLAAAMALPAARTYPAPLLSQPNPSMCGPTSVADVLRSLGVSAADPGSVLAGTALCLTGLCFGGLTLDELAEVVRHSGRKATVHRDLTPEVLRQHLRASNAPARRYIVNFTRQPIFGVGGGHFSPLAGYLEERDLALVLDVNGSFRPWLVERDKLFSAIDTVDPSSHRKRGLLEIE